MYVVTIFVVFLLFTSSSGILFGDLMSLKPYFARITYRIGTTEIDIERAGSIVSDRFILTTGDSTGAEHTIFVHVGATNRSSQTKLATRSWIRLTSSNDSPGLIQLAETLIFSSKIQPIRLSPVSEVLELTGVQGMILGMSENENYFSAAFQRVTNNTMCIENYPTRNSSLFFCGMDSMIKSDFCVNDRGSGFTVTSRGREYLVGIAIESSCNPINNTKPSLFLRLSRYRQIIHNVMHMMKFQ